MNQPVIDKWVAALRSGEYKQGHGYLKIKKDKETCHCCLGVLCELYAKENPLFRSGSISDVDGEVFRFGKSLKEGMLPDEVRRWAGLSNDDGGFGVDDHETLAYLNDDGKTFAEIADIIESKPEGLFV